VFKFIILFCADPTNNFEISDVCANPKCTGRMKATVVSGMSPAKEIVSFKEKAQAWNGGRKDCK